MIVDLIDKLIDRCIQLIQRREKVARELYSDFLAPALLAFEDLHKNYVESFMTYRKMLDENREPMNKDHPILKLITDDSLVTADMRSRILALRSFDSDPDFGRFIRRMCQYIQGGGVAPLILLKGSQPIPNASRQVLYAGLETIFGESMSNEEKKLSAIEQTTRVLNELQQSYQLVLDEHTRLKAKLLGLKVPKEALSQADAVDLAFEKRFSKLLKRRSRNSRETETPPKA